MQYSGFVMEKSPKVRDSIGVEDLERPVNRW